MLTVSQVLRIIYDCHFYQLHFDNVQVHMKFAFLNKLILIGNQISELELFFNESLKFGAFSL